MEHEYGIGSERADEERKEAKELPQEHNAGVEPTSEVQHDVETVPSTEDLRFERPRGIQFRIPEGNWRGGWTPWGVAICVGGEVIGHQQDAEGQEMPVHEYRIEAADVAFPAHVTVYKNEMNKYGEVSRAELDPIPHEVQSVANAVAAVVELTHTVPGSSAEAHAMERLHAVDLRITEKE